MWISCNFYTFSHIFGFNGFDIKSGSVIPGSYKLVRPTGNGGPLSDEYIISVLLRTPNDLSSLRISPIPVWENFLIICEVNIKNQILKKYLKLWTLDLITKVKNY